MSAPAPADYCRATARAAYVFVATNGRRSSVGFSNEADNDADRKLWTARCTAMGKADMADASYADRHAEHKRMVCGALTSLAGPPTVFASARAATALLDRGSHCVDSERCDAFLRTIVDQQARDARTHTNNMGFLGADIAIEVDAMIALGRQFQDREASAVVPHLNALFQRIRGHKWNALHTRDVSVVFVHMLRRLHKGLGLAAAGDIMGQWKASNTRVCLQMTSMMKVAFDADMCAKQAAIVASVPVAERLQKRSYAMLHLLSTAIESGLDHDATRVALNDIRAAHEQECTDEAKRAKLE